MKKFVIIGGCSYGLKSQKTLIDILSQYNKSDYKLVEVNSSAASSKFITESIITCCDELLSKGIKSENILVINNFTQIGRTNPLLSDELKKEVKKTIEVTEHRTVENIDFKFYNHFVEIQDRLYSLMVGGGHKSSILKNWLKQKENYYITLKNPLTHFEEYLQNILLLQTYTKSKNIFTISYMMSNVFDGWSDDLSHVYNEIYKWELPSTKGYKHISELSNITKILWEMIDLDKIVFYKTKNNKYGGIDEYFIDKFKEEKYLENTIESNRVFYGNHPNEEVYESFIKNIIQPKLQEWNRQHIL